MSSRFTAAVVQSSPVVFEPKATLAKVYCTVLFFAPDGAVLGKHRKLMPTAMERLIWGFGDGSTLPVFDTPLVVAD